MKITFEDEQITQKYSFAGIFSNDRAVVKDAKTGLYGYIDKTGKEVIPCVYTEAHVFEGDYATVSYCGQVLDDYIDIFIDKNGRKVDSDYAIEYYKEFYKDEPQEVQIYKDSRKLGYKKANGDIITSAIFDTAFDFVEDCGMVGITDAGVNGIVDINGKVILFPISEHLLSQFSYNGLILDYNSYQRTYGFMGKDGEMKIPHQFTKATHFSEGLANVTIGCDKQAYINTNGEVVFRFGGTFKSRVSKDGVHVFDIYADNEEELIKKKKAAIEELYKFAEDALRIKIEKLEQSKQADIDKVGAGDVKKPAVKKRRSLGEEIARKHWSPEYRKLK